MSISGHKVSTYETKSIMKKFIETLQSAGIYSFSRELVKGQLKISEAALKKVLQRYEKKKRILRIRRKFFIIIPIEYKVVGILPPFWFIDNLMKYLGVNYYVGLISAANIYGASHQQPQVFQVITEKKLRSINTKLIKIEFINKPKFPDKYFIEKRKTETGIIKVSSPELTGFDLVKYIKQSGGINRVVSIIIELIDSINNNNLSTLAKKEIKPIYIQRLGYIFKFLNEDVKAGILKKTLRGRRKYPVQLVPNRDKKTGILNKEWRVIVNYDIEVESI